MKRTMNKSKNYKNKLILINLFIIIFLINLSCSQIKQTKRIDIETKRELIDDKETAIKIAEVILVSVYGNTIYENKPFKARSIKNNTVWMVKGTLKYDVGGVPFIEIQKKDCKVIRFGHSK